MPTDYGHAVELLLGPGKKFKSATTYQQLVDTWEDTNPPAAPSQAALDAAYTAGAPALTAGINCLITGARPVIIIPASATRPFLPTLIRLAVAPTSLGITTPPTISIGGNSPNYDNVMASVALASLNLTAVNRMRNSLLGSTTHTFMLVAPTTVYINVTVAANATAYNLGVKIEGVYLDL